MNYSFHKNGWTVLIDENFDLRKATQDDINLISKLIAHNTCVVIRNQNLTVQDELNVINMFKNPAPLHKPGDERFEDFAADLEIDPEGVICRVTAELRNGATGLAAMKSELIWHCNQTHKQDRSPIIWLYGVRGTAGSRTSWNNTILAYADLDQETKNKLENLKCIYTGGSTLSVDREAPSIVEEEWTPSLVHKNIANKVGMYFSPLQMDRFAGMSKEESKLISDPLFEHVTQEKYLYHHDWRDGDLVISEQWLGIHKRWPFPDMDTRLVHRAAVDFPDQDYSTI